MEVLNNIIQGKGVSIGKPRRKKRVPKQNQRELAAIYKLAKVNSIQDQDKAKNGTDNAKGSKQSEAAKTAQDALIAIEDVILGKKNISRTRAGRRAAIEAGVETDVMAAAGPSHNTRRTARQENLDNGVGAQAKSSEINWKSMENTSVTVFDEAARDGTEENGSQTAGFEPEVQPESQTHIIEICPDLDESIDNLERILEKIPDNKSKRIIRRMKRKRKDGSENDRRGRRKLAYVEPEETEQEALIPEFEELNEGIIYDDGNVWEMSPRPPNTCDSNRGILVSPKSDKRLSDTDFPDKADSHEQKKLRVKFLDIPPHTRFYHSPILLRKKKAGEARKRRFKEKPPLTKINENPTGASVLSGWTAPAPEASGNNSGPVNINFGPLPPLIPIPRDPHNVPDVLPSLSLLLRSPTMENSYSFSHPDTPKSSMHQDAEFLPFPTDLNRNTLYGSEEFLEMASAGDSAGFTFNQDMENNGLSQFDAGQSNTQIVNEDTSNATTFAPSSEEMSTGMYENSELENHDSKNPLFEMLIGCNDPISKITNELNNSAMAIALPLALEARGITTIGQFCKLTQADLLKFPIMAPRIGRTLKVLQDYYTFKSKRNAAKADADQGSNVTDDALGELLSGEILNHPEFSSLPEDDTPVIIGEAHINKSENDNKLEVSQSQTASLDMFSQADRITVDVESEVGGQTSPLKLTSTQQPLPDFSKLTTCTELFKFIEQGSDLSRQLVKFLITSDGAGDIIFQEIPKFRDCSRRIACGFNVAGQDIMDFFDQAMTEDTKIKLRTECQIPMPEEIPPGFWKNTFKSYQDHYIKCSIQQARSSRLSSSLLSQDPTDSPSGGDPVLRRKLQIMHMCMQANLSENPKAFTSFRGTGKYNDVSNLVELVKTVVSDPESRPNENDQQELESGAFAFLEAMTPESRAQFLAKFSTKYVH